MKQIYCTGLLIVSVLTAIAATSCENAKVENAAPNANTAAADRNSQNAANNIAAQNSGGDGGSSSSNSSFSHNAGAVSNDNSKGDSNAQSTGTNAPETADFAGTAGVTEKKYQTTGVAVLKEVRAAGHAAPAGYDRIVFEFAGSEMPSYHIEYIDKPVRSCGSGAVVPLKGDGWLEIRFTPAAAHTEDGKPTVKDREQAPNLKIIKEIKSTCDFEAEVEWVLGVASPNKYRATELKNPMRLAVDIKH